LILMKNSERKQRLMILARLKMTSSFHTGSGHWDNPYSDQPILRDTSKRPFISGATLAGSLGALLSSEQRNQWLGSGEGGSSRLIIDDAYPLPQQLARLRSPVEVRSRNALDRDSLTVIDKSFFNIEVLPAGTVFRFSCRCDLDKETELNEIKKMATSFFDKGGILGAGGNIGLGEWQAGKLFIRVFDMSCKDDLISWLIDFHGFEWDGSEKMALEKGFEELHLETVSKIDNWQLKCKVELDNGLHLSATDSGLPVKGKPDLGQSRRLKIDENGKLFPERIDFGSTIRGRLRTAMEMLLRTYLVYHNEDKRSEDVRLAESQRVLPHDPRKSGTSETVNMLFGDSEHKSPWRVSENPWENSETQTEDHIKLDEFTQQVIDGAKFDFEPLKKGSSEVTIALTGGAEWHKILLYYAVRLLALDILPWGGHGSRGYLGARVRIIADDIPVSMPQNPGVLLREVLQSVHNETQST